MRFYWVVCDAKDANITGHRGVAVREFQLKKGHGFADYMLYVDGNLPEPGVIAAEIVADLEAALEQFRLIAEDLGDNATATDRQ